MDKPIGVGAVFQTVREFNQVFSSLTTLVLVLEDRKCLRRIELFAKVHAAFVLGHVGH